MTITKKLACSAVAAMMFVSAVSPAEARHRYQGRDHVDAGDIIGAAVVLGGIALIASSLKGNNGYGGNYGAERQAVQACVREAEQGSSRYDATRVSDITNVDRRDGYYVVSGILETQEGYGDDDYRGEDYDRDSDSFTCTARGGRIYDFQLSSGYRW
jgi:hypothetical protein